MKYYDYIFFLIGVNHYLSLFFFPLLSVILWHQVVVLQLNSILTLSTWW